MKIRKYIPTVIAQSVFYVVKVLKLVITILMLYKKWLKPGIRNLNIRHFIG